MRSGVGVGGDKLSRAMTKSGLEPGCDACVAEGRQRVSTISLNLEHNPKNPEVLMEHCCIGATSLALMQGHQGALPGQCYRAQANATSNGTRAAQEPGSPGSIDIKKVGQRWL